ncbi:DUF2218 domain-containing protein [Glacieibacterium frigidum]|uniref:DUF2218 domain-containing protein n=1 Tax=Glacieibacterium frigidum TaxID=2593303 RepID=A0A552U8X4_9SPHN|nr:DUF2218 domain-containing protein [Glacieibacterium frigidum]TRW14677.1 DUF2218 domain-containing protein [Glacieibacterium frigidum]
MDSIATVPTENASRYLQQLCKHWSHKLEVEFDAIQGRVAFPTSAVRFDAAPHALTMTLAGPDAATLDRMEPVVAEHLRRFAFREELAVDWVRG